MKEVQRAHVLLWDIKRNFHLTLGNLISSQVSDPEKLLGNVRSSLATKGSTNVEKLRNSAQRGLNTLLLVSKCTASPTRIYFQKCYLIFSMLVLLFSLLILHLTALRGCVCVRGGRLKKEVIAAKHRGTQIFQTRAAEASVSSLPTKPFCGPTGLTLLSQTEKRLNHCLLCCAQSLSRG